MLSGTIDPQVLLEKCTSSERDPLSLISGSDVGVGGSAPTQSKKKMCPFLSFPNCRSFKPLCELCSNREVPGWGSSLPVVMAVAVRIKSNLMACVLPSLPVCELCH